MTAENLVKAAERALALQPSGLSGKLFSRSRRLPGGVAYSEKGIAALRRELCEGLDEEERLEVERAIGRFGMRARKVFESGPARTCEEILLRQAEYICAHELAETVEDIVQRRLGIDRLPRAEQNNSSDFKDLFGHLVK